jgi:hypothetical protein
MNRLSMTVAAAALLAAPAFAYTGVSPQMLAEVDQILNAEGFAAVEPTSLTDRQVVEIYLLSQRDDGSRELIEATLRGEGLEASYSANAEAMAAQGVVIEEGENSVARTVGNWLQTEGLIAGDETVALTDAQVAELYTLAFGDASPGEKRETAARILEQ